MNPTFKTGIPAAVGVWNRTDVDFRVILIVSLKKQHAFDVKRTTEFSVWPPAYMAGTGRTEVTVRGCFG